MFERCLYLNASALAHLVERELTPVYAEFGLTPAQGFVLRMRVDRAASSDETRTGRRRIDGGGHAQDPQSAWMTKRFQTAALLIIPLDISAHEIVGAA